MEVAHYLLIDPEEVTRRIRNKSSRRAKVARALVWWENSRIASKQAEVGLKMNEHETFGGAPAQHFSRALYGYLPRELRAQVTAREFYSAMEVLKKAKVAWVWKTLKGEEGFTHLHMWNLQSGELTGVFGWSGERLERDEALTLLEDYSVIAPTGSEPARSYWIRQALGELQDD
jgi:hypothetical protein